MKLKFFLRDLFWAILVAAICSCWWIHSRRSTILLEESEAKREAVVSELISELKVEQAKLATEQTKSAKYKDWFARQQEMPTLPAGRKMKAEWDDEQALFRDAYFYLREFAPKRDPDEL
jgi:hypothetical protein